MKTKHIRNPYIVIAAYLEGPVIRSVITDLQSKGYTSIIVVNDGSPDNTSAEIEKTHEVVLTQHIVNRGKGAAIRTGIAIAKSKNADAVITFDADGQHNPKDIANLIAGLESGFDVALGTRAENSESMPAIKRIANWIANTFTFLLFGIHVSDSQCGLRAYSRHALETIVTNADRYAYDTEVIREIRRNNLSFTEVPIDTLYTKHSQSKAERQSFITGIKTLFKLISSL